MRNRTFASLLVALAGCAPVQAYHGDRLDSLEVAEVTFLSDGAVSISDRAIDDFAVGAFASGATVPGGPHEFSYTAAHRDALCSFDPEHCIGTVVTRRCVGRFTARGGQRYTIRINFAGAVVLEGDNPAPIGTASCE